MIKIDNLIFLIPLQEIMTTICKAYKACKNSIVVLELLENSITNEKRKDVINPSFAKFRTNKVKVIKIIDVLTGDELDSDRSIYDPNFIYKVGEIIQTEINSDINTVCGEGIHYFKTYKAALSWYYHNNINQIKNGTFIEYHENGRRDVEWNYLDGKLNGLQHGWYDNGQKNFEWNYLNGNREGLHQWWHTNGEKGITMMEN